MGWQEYYRFVQPVSLGEQGFAYTWAVDILTRQQPGFLGKEKINALLGGFHAFSGTASGFSDFCRYLHPNPQNNLILMDMNDEPMGTFSSHHKVQGRLEELPFSDSSLDLIVLDHTLDFMDDEQTKKFFREVERTLTPEGLVLATIHGNIMINQPLVNRLRNKYRSLTHRVSYYARSPKVLTGLLDNLQVNLEGAGKRFHLFAFSQFQSPYPAHEGSPYAFYEYLAHPEHFFPRHSWLDQIKDYSGYENQPLPQPI